MATAKFHAALEAAFLETANAEISDKICGQQQLGAQIESWFRDASELHPGVQLEPIRFARHVGARFIALAGEEEDKLSELRYSDLYLVAACLSGDDRANKIITSYVAEEARAALMRMDSSGELAREVAQTVLASLVVVDTTDRRGLEGYAGRGDLRAWLRVSCLRLGIRIRKRCQHEVPVDDQALLALAPDPADPALEHLKVHYKRELSAIFPRAIAALTPREQNILRQHYVDELTTEEIAKIHNVHRVSVSRWLSSARHTLLATARGLVEEELGVSQSECDSILRLVESRLSFVSEVWGRDQQE